MSELPVQEEQAAAAPSAPEARFWFGLGLLLVAAAGLMATATYDLPFYTKGQAREATVVMAMVDTGQFVLPLRNGTDIPSKPPLFHWLASAVSLAADRLDEFTVRLPSVAGSLVALAATALAGMRLFGPRTGLMAFLVLLTSHQWMISSTSARVDMTLSALVTLCLVTALLDRGGARRHPGLIYAAAALAVLAKGPVGAVLPAAILLVYLLLAGDLAYLLGFFKKPALLWVLVPVAWYLAGWAEGGQAFVDKLILKENLYRILDPEAVGAGHAHGPVYYLPALAIGMAPWSLLLPAALVGLVGRRSGNPGGTGFLVCWAVGTVALFSFAGSKRPVYILPAYPPLAILVGHWIAGLGDHGETRKPALWLLRVTVWLLSVIIALLTGVVVLETAGLSLLGTIEPFLSANDTANLPAVSSALRAHPLIMLGWAVATALLLALLARASRRAAWPRAFVTLAVLVALAAAVPVLTVQRELARGQSLASFVQTAAPVLGKEPLFFYRPAEDRTELSGSVHRIFETMHYAAIFYARRPIPEIGSLAELPAQGPYWLLAGESSLGDLTSRAQDTLAFSVMARHDWGGNIGREALLLVRADPVATQPETDGDG